LAPVEESLNWIWIVVVIAAIGAVSYFSYTRAKKRRAELATFAAQYRLQYSRTDPFGLTRLGFRLLSLGDGRGCENVVWGEWQGMPFKEADYWYYTESTDSKGRRSKSYRRFSIVLADIDAFLPGAVIARENLFTRMADHTGFRDIEFELEDFNRRFNVKATDREFAYKLVDARMMQWLLNAGKYGFEVFGGQILVYSGRHRPGELVPLIGTAKGFRDQIPRLVWSQYGIEPRNSTERSLP
jgi:hypothetical protein